MNASSIDVFQPDFLLQPRLNPKKSIGSDSFISDFVKIAKLPSKSLHKSQSLTPIRDPHENSQMNSMIQGNKISKNLSKMFNDSRLSCRESSILMKKTYFGESMIEKLQKWEQGFELDEEFHEKLGNCFSEVEHKIQTLETQFLNALSFNKKLETQIFEMSEIAKGWSFIKISYKNPKKSNTRTVFYSHNLEAICWKDPKSRFPTQKQAIFLKDIRNVATKSNKQVGNHDMSNFISIETSQRSLDLLAPNQRVKEIFVRLLSCILKNFKQNFGKDEEGMRMMNENREMGFLNNQYNAQIEQMRKDIGQTKVLFEDVTSRLRRNFFETAKLWVREEKNKGLVLKKHTARLEEKLKRTLQTVELTTNQKNKLSKELSEALLKNKHLIKQMKQLIEQSNGFSSELSKITQELREVVKKNDPGSQDLERKQLENLSFNLIDSRYMEFDKINNFSAFTELRKLMEVLIKTKEKGGFALDIRNYMEENEILRKNNAKMKSCLDQLGIECQVKDEFITKLEQKFIELRVKQNQLGSQIEPEFHEILRQQRILREELQGVCSEKTLTDLTIQNESLKSNLEGKIQEINDLTVDLEFQKRCFEGKMKQVLTKVSDQEIEIHNLRNQRLFAEEKRNDELKRRESFDHEKKIEEELKKIIKEKDEIIDFFSKNIEETKSKMLDYEQRIQKQEREKEESLNQKSLEFEQKTKLYQNEIKEAEIQIKEAKMHIQELSSQIDESKRNETKLHSENEYLLQEITGLSEKNELLEGELLELQQRFTENQVKIKEEVEKQMKSKIDFAQNNLNALKRLYEENKTTFIELKKNVLIVYFSFMVIISAYNENKENTQTNESNIRLDYPLSYSDKFRSSLAILFSILADFFPKSSLKDLENAIKKVFNLVVRTPTEFNRKPLDELYMKLERNFNRNFENDVSSLGSMRSFCLEGLASPKMSELNLSSLKLNNL